MTSDDDLFSELYRILRLGEKFRNFAELYIGYDEMEQLCDKNIFVLVHCAVEACAKEQIDDRSLKELQFANKFSGVTRRWGRTAPDDTIEG